MFSSIGFIALMAGGILACAFGQKGDNDEIVYDKYDSLYYKKDTDSYEQETYEYFMGLTIQEQERYYHENVDLNYWKDDNYKGLTNDRYLNAKHAAEVARVMGKKFTDKYKTY